MSKHFSFIVDFDCFSSLSVSQISSYLLGLGRYLCCIRQKMLQQFLCSRSEDGMERHIALLSWLQLCYCCSTGCWGCSDVSTIPPLPSPPQPPPPGRPRVVTSAGSEKRARPAWLRAAPHRLGRRPPRDARPRTKSPPDRLQREPGRWGRGPGHYQTPAVGTSGTGGGCRRSEETRG